MVCSMTQSRLIHYVSVSFWLSSEIRKGKVLEAHIFIRKMKQIYLC